MNKKSGFMLSDALFAVAALIICMYLSIQMSNLYTKNLMQTKRHIYFLDEIKNKLIYEEYNSEELNMDFETEEEIFVEDTKIYIKILTVKDNENVKKEYKILQK